MMMDHHTVSIDDDNNDINNNQNSQNNNSPTTSSPSSPNGSNRKATNNNNATSSTFVNKQSLHAYQIRALLLKQITLQLRQKKTIACQILFPIVMLLCIFLFTVIMKKAIGRFPKPPPVPQIFEPLPIPTLFQLAENMVDPSEKPLFENRTAYFPHRFLFTKSEPNTVEQELGVLGPNGQASGFLGQMNQTWMSELLESIGVNMVPYAVHVKDRKEMDSVMYQSQKRSGHLDAYFGAVEFSALQSNGSAGGGGGDKGGVGLRYTVQAAKDCSLYTVFGRFGVNSEFCSYGFTAYLMNSVNNAFVKSVFGDLAFSIKASIQKMPFISDLDIASLMFDNSAQIIHLVLLFPLPMFIYTLLLEKTSRIREMMKLNGMRMKYYWSTYLLFNAAIYCLFTCVLCYVCSLAFGFRYAFSNPFVILLFFAACCVNILGFSIFLASVLNNVLIGIILGYLGALFFPSITNLVETYIISKSGNQFLFLLLIPPFATEHAFTSGLINPCKNYQCPSWKVFTSWNPYVAGVTFMFLNGIVYTLIGLYLDAIMPREWGITKHPLFFLKPIRTLFSRIFSSVRSKSSGTSSETSSLLSRYQSLEDETDESALLTSPSKKDVDVERERNNVLRAVSTIEQGTTEHVPPIVIHDLNKFYGSFQAVKDLSLTIESGTCFGLLGPNGAGKSTTCNMLCGLAKPSKGTAFINRFDITSEMDMVQRSLGLAPQYEVVYDDLTVEEHLLFYARLKGVPRSEEKHHVESIMESVGLHLPEHRVKYAKELSGGMRRRLSLAMALCGDPAVILCDEPTTGLDPTSRRQVWSIIQKQKEQGRCIVLTTHSLDEADVLCDRIGIVKTELMCIGSSFHLKNKFGQSYRLTLNYNVSSRPIAESTKMIEDFIKTNICPTMTSSSQFAGNLVVELPKADVKVDISRLFNLIEAYKAETVDLIEEYNFSQTTLEDVFLAITATGEDANKFT